MNADEEMEKSAFISVEFALERREVRVYQRVA
jgi:hypothetical protein